MGPEAQINRSLVSADVPTGYILPIALMDDQGQCQSLMPKAS